MLIVQDGLKNKNQALYRLIHAPDRLCGIKFFSDTRIVLLLFSADCFANVQKITRNAGIGTQHIHAGDYFHCVGGVVCQPVHLRFTCLFDQGFYVC